MRGDNRTPLDRFSNGSVTTPGIDPIPALLKSSFSTIERKKSPIRRIFPCMNGVGKSKLTHAKKATDRANHAALSDVGR